MAHEAGYFDQAHFIKDFKAFTGQTPLSGSDRKIDQGFIADAQSGVVSAIRVVAANLEAAVDLAKACPTLEVGGAVEVRKVQPSPFR